MQTKKQLVQDIESTAIGRDVAEIFESSAAGHLKSIRDSILGTRQFLDEVGAVYRQVKRSYFEENERMKARPTEPEGITGRFHKEHKPDPELAVLNKNGKVAAVLLSANKGLYGDLPLRIASEFVRQYQQLTQSVSKKPVDVVVIGRLGQFLLQNFPVNGAPIPFTFFSVNDEDPTREEIQPIVDKLVLYDDVFVCYGKFQSLLHLVPETDNISGGSDVDAIAASSVQESGAVGGGTKAGTASAAILFEPSIKSVAAFFEKEVLGALFRQKLYEMELARYASRMLAMDAAVDRANDELKDLRQVERKIKRTEANRKLEQIFAGMQLW